MSFTTRIFYPTKTSIFYVRIATELWYTTLLSGEKRVDYISITKTTHPDFPGDTIWSLTLFKWNIAGGIVKCSH